MYMKTSKELSSISKRVIIINSSYWVYIEKKNDINRENLKILNKLVEISKRKNVSDRELLKKYNSLSIVKILGEDLKQIVAQSIKVIW